MKEDKVRVLRKTLVIITVMLIFITIGISLVALQIKTVTFNYFGSVKTVKTMSTTVEGFLLQNKIVVKETDTVVPSLNTIIDKDIEIKIYSNKVLSKLSEIEICKNYNPDETKIIEVAEVIPYTEETVNNPTINRGVTKVANDGTNGEKIVKYLIKYSGTSEIYKVELQSEVKEEPINKVIEVGTKLNTTVSRTAALVIPTVDTNFKTYNVKLPVDQQQYLYSVCQKYGVQYELMLAIMYQESTFNPNAIGGGNSYGLCQVHISNLSMLQYRLGITDLLDPYDNIKAGVYMYSIYMNAALRASSDTRIQEVYALNSYNMGEANYLSTCYNNGIIDRYYSNSVISLRNRLINNGGL